MVTKATIYTGLGIGGVVLTGIAAFVVGTIMGQAMQNKVYEKAIPKALDQENIDKLYKEVNNASEELRDVPTLTKKVIPEMVKSGEFKGFMMSMAKAALPVMATGAATIFCIAQGDKLNRAEIKKAKNAFNKYQKSAKEIFGEKGHKRIVDNINKVPCNRNVTITNDGFLTLQSLDFGVDEEETVHTFYDSYSNRYFESTISKVLQAQYHINRNWSLGMEPSINLYYSYLGLDPIDNGDDIYWDFDNCEGFIDFNNRKETLDDGMEILTIDIVTPPDKNDKED